MTNKYFKNCLRAVHPQLIYEMQLLHLRLGKQHRSASRKNVRARGPGCLLLERSPDTAGKMHP